MYFEIVKNGEILVECFITNRNYHKAIVKINYLGYGDWHHEKIRSRWVIRFQMGIKIKYNKPCLSLEDRKPDSVMFPYGGCTMTSVLNYTMISMNM